MPNLNIDSIALVSTQRKVPLNGAPSTQDWNDGEQEKLLDLVALASLINDVIRPILNALPDTASSGLEGSTLYADTSDQNPAFFDTANGVPLTVADSIRTLNALLSLHQNQLADLDIEIGQLQSKLSSTNQNDISKTLQSLTSSLNAISNTQTSQSAALSVIQAAEAKEQSVRQATGNILPNTTETVVVTWPVSLGADGYVVNLSMEEDTGGLQIISFSYLTPGSSISVRVANNSLTDTLAGFVHATSH